MKVKVKNYEKWIFPKEWLETLKTEFHLQLPSKKICLIIEDKEQKDYILSIKGNNSKVFVHVSVCNSVKDDIITIFEKGYLKALVEHEIKHLQPNITLYFNKIIAPNVILETHNKDFYEYVYLLINSKFYDFLNDVYANSAMTAEDLKKYLEFETSKICSDWDTLNKVEFVRIPFMLFTSYIEACYTAIGENPPNELKTINKCLQDDYSNVAIYKQMVEVYLEMWKAVRLGQKDIDLNEKTTVLQKLIERQPRHFV